MLFKKKRQHRFLLNANDSIVINDKSMSDVSEAYVRLKDNVLYFAIDGKKKVLQIESSTSAEGKTTLCANLAVSLADNKKKVLVIDLDLRKPRLHRCFGIDIDNGITDYLKGDLDITSVVKTTPFKVDVVTRGSSSDNVSLILTSQKLADFVNGMRDKYDFILIDCPPILVANDFIHISRFTDSILFAYAYGLTKKSEVKEAILEINKNNIDIFGSVFTFYDQARSDYYEYKKYSYNYYYSKNNTEIDNNK